MSRIAGIGRALAITWIISRLLAPGTAAAAEPPAQNTIRVVAQATVAAQPDQAELEVGVITDKKTAVAAVAENESAMQKVIASIKKEIGKGDEVRTSELSVRPRFEQMPNGEITSRVVGYTVTNRVHVRVGNIKAAGRLLDVAFQAGANTVESVTFTLKDPEAAQNAALRSASAKARARATAMAEGQGLRVGDVIAVSEGAHDGGPIEGGFPKAAMLRSASVEPGSIEVTATVTVVYALKAR
jgi:uncharacterized protein YggE